MRKINHSTEHDYFPFQWHHFYLLNHLMKCFFESKWLLYKRVNVKIQYESSGFQQTISLFSYTWQIEKKYPGYRVTNARQLVLSFWPTGTFTMWLLHPNYIVVWRHKPCYLHKNVNSKPSNLNKDKRHLYH